MEHDNIAVMTFVELNLPDRAYPPTGITIDECLQHTFLSERRDIRCDNFYSTKATVKKEKHIGRKSKMQPIKCLHLKRYLVFVNTLTAS